MALMQAGFILMLLGATLLPDSRARALGALAAVTAGLALAGLRAAPGFAATPVALIGLAALFVVLIIGPMLLLPGRFVQSAALEPDAVGPPPRPVAGVVGLVAGALAVAVGPHLSVVVFGAVLAGWSGYLLERAAGGSRVPIAPALTLILLPAWWIMALVAGPEGLWIKTLPAVPLSPAAERLLAPAFLVCAWALCGLWPLHRQMPAALSAPVGALLLARVALPAMPDGLEHWRALAMPLVVAGAWHAALTGRTTRLAVGLAWVGLLAPDREGIAGAGLLLAAAMLSQLTGPMARRDARLATGIRLALGLAVGGGGLLAVAAGLRGEVVYTVLAVGAVVAAARHALAGQARTASDPRTTAPNA
jgi:hypothetical protein